MLIFSGVNPYGWIAQAEQYFRVFQSQSQDLLGIVSLSLVEVALSWYNYETEH